MDYLTVAFVSQKLYLLLKSLLSNCGWVGENIAFICRAIATLIASVESNFVTNYPVGSLHTYGN